jgi:hypothetical protein
MNNSSQIVNKVYKTNDLSIFKTIEGNRPPNPQHIRRLADSITVNGILCNPILVNQKYEVIDGQHRLLAAKKVNSDVYYIILENYGLNEVHALNLNQKNWSRKDFMEGYANMGIESYKKLKLFYNYNNDFNFSDCIALCSNITGGSSAVKAQQYRKDGAVYNMTEIFEEGTWTGKDFNLAQEYADKIRMIKSFYYGYNRSTFVGTMIGMLQNKNFDFNEFMHKLRLQPTALEDCSSRQQYKLLIEDIYNYRSRNKVNLRY